MTAMQASAAEEQAWNERALSQTVERPAWRVWRYARPAIVLGCSQRRLFETLAAQQAAPDTELLLRRSGGGAVLVGPWMIGISAALPPEHVLVREGPVPSYRWLGTGLVRVLQRFGVAARALSPAELGRPAQAERHAAATQPAPDADLRWACFAGLSPWEAVAGERKITGLAQVRRRSGVLLVAGVLIQPPDWALLCAALGRPAAEAAALARVTTCCADQGAAGLTPDVLADAVDAEIARLLAPAEGDMAGS